jgi:hypothetical protein
MKKNKQTSDVMNLQYNSELNYESDFDYSFLDEKAVFHTKTNVVNDIDYNVLNNYMADNIDNLCNFDIDA